MSVTWVVSVHCESMVGSMSGNLVGGRLMNVLDLL